jgi:hypothetical protein
MIGTADLGVQTASRALCFKHNTDRTRGTFSFGFLEIDGGRLVFDDLG